MPALNSTVPELGKYGLRIYVRKFERTCCKLALLVQSQIPWFSCQRSLPVGCSFKAHKLEWMSKLPRVFGLPCVFLVLNNGRPYFRDSWVPLFVYLVPRVQGLKS